MGSKIIIAKIAENSFSLSDYQQAGRDKTLLRCIAHSLASGASFVVYE